MVLNNSGTDRAYGCLRTSLSRLERDICRRGAVSLYWDLNAFNLYQTPNCLTMKNSWKIHQILKQLSVELLAEKTVLVQALNISHNCFDDHFQYGNNLLGHGNYFFKGYGNRHIRIVNIGYGGQAEHLYSGMDRRNNFLYE